MENRKTYNTKQRNAVLACFSSQPRRSMSAQEVYEELSQNQEMIGRTTIYRTIARLVEEGSLFRVKEAGPAAIARYQHRGENPKSISVRCSGCGLIAALTCEAVGEFEAHLEEDHGFVLKENECILPGFCSGCRKADSPSKPANKQSRPK